VGSAFGDPQWIYVDLGATATISRVVLSWEAAFGVPIRSSVRNATSWTTIILDHAGDGARNRPSRSRDRPLRARKWHRPRDAFGYSLWELQVYGTAAAVALRQRAERATGWSPPG